MTPEKLERTIEFIVEHQAQAAAHIEQLAVAFRAAEEQRIKDQVLAREVQSAVVILTELAQIQSSRLARHEEAFQVLHEDLKESLNRLDQILRRLTDRN